MAKWFVSAKKADFDKIGKKYGIDPLIARLIRNRDVTDEEAVGKYLNGTPDDLYSPFLMRGMEEAVRVILAAAKQKRKVRVIGDYDVDGVCSAYILQKGFAALGLLADTVVPHRIRDGYGLNNSLIEEAARAGVELIVTCDNGIAAKEQIDYASSLGIAAVVTDHHEVPYEEADGVRTYILPDAAAVVDPRQEGCLYPFKGICGGVVAFKLIQALLERAGTPEEEAGPLLGELLELAAFATVGDVMELRDENRIIVRYGLERMKHSANRGIAALLQVNGIEPESLSAYHIGFVLGPCLNAGGRLDTAERALALLQETDRAEAVRLAGELKGLNDSRKDMTAKGVEEACRKIEGQGFEGDRVLVVYLPECHESLAGIIAGRVREKYARPVFILTRAGEGVKGSGRSVEAYHMYEEMSRCKDLFTRYGGHKMAAGLSMEEKDIEAFRSRLNEACRLTEEELEERVHIDAAMPFSYVNEKLIAQLSLLEPFGNGNPKPLFAQKDVRFLSGRVLGKNRNVGKYTVTDAQGTGYELIFFGDLQQLDCYIAGKYSKEALQGLYEGSGRQDVTLSVAYYPSINEFRGRRSIQYVMQYYR